MSNLRDKGFLTKSMRLSTLDVWGFERLKDGALKIFREMHSNKRGHSEDPSRAPGPGSSNNQCPGYQLGKTAHIGGKDGNVAVSWLFVEQWTDDGLEWGGHDRSRMVASKKWLRIEWPRNHVVFIPFRHDAWSSSLTKPTSSSDLTQWNIFRVTISLIPVSSLSKCFPRSDQACKWIQPDPHPFFFFRLSIYTSWTTFNVGQAQNIKGSYVHPLAPIFE